VKLKGVETWDTYIVNFDNSMLWLQNFLQFVCVGGGRGVNEVSPLGEQKYIPSKHWNIFNDKEYTSWPI